MRLTKGIADFGNGTITIYPKLDPFLDSSGEEEKIGDDWDLLLDDLDFGDIPDIEGVEVPPFVCKMGKNSRNKRKQLEKYQLIYSDLGPSLSTGKPLTHEEAEREALAIDIYKRYSLLEEKRPVIETMTYSDKYKKILDEICIDKMKLDGEMKKEEEEVIIGIKGEALIEKEDPGAFMITIQIEGGAHEASEGCPVPGFLYTCGSILNTIERITSTFDGLCHQMFRATKTSLDTAESDSDEEEEYAIQRNKFKAPIYGPKPASQAAKSRYNTRLAQLLPKLIYSPCVMDWNILNQMGCGEAIDEMLTIKLFVAGTNEEIFTSEAWTNAFNIDEPIYRRLCPLSSIYIRLGTLPGASLKRGLGLYHSKEIEEKGFDVYFQGGLRSDEHLMCTFKVGCVAMSHSSHAQRVLVLRSVDGKNLVLSKASHFYYMDPLSWTVYYKISKRKNLLSGEVLNSLSAPIHTSALDTYYNLESDSTCGVGGSEAPRARLYQEYYS
ncbi:hypothetical protein Tco_1507544 [Tanacetum coccineum]